jgi:predicted unusual protein kinase regulating ubiquinone biosynthesis (AarF/ABC1/UbiB family)
MAAASPDAIDSFDTRSAASATRTQVHRASSKGDLVAMKAVKRALRTRRDIPLVFDEAADTSLKLGRSR